MAESSRYGSALTRNLAEIQKILLIRATLLGAHKHRGTTKIFSRIVAESLKNDHESHAMKVFEQSSKAASFWYLYRTDPGPIDRHARKVGYDIAHLQVVSDKLKVIRNGTHFHIDKVGVVEPRAIWSDASLTGKELGAAIDFVWGALSSIQTSKGGSVPSLLDYTPDDALEAFRRVEGVELGQF